MKRFVIITAVVFCACSHKQHADLIVHHAKVYTVDSAFSLAEAFAVKDGKFLAIGTDKGITANFESSDVVDADGKAVYPGFIDAHSHFVGYGQELFTADLFNTSSFEEALARLKAFAASHPNEPWILGRGWDQNKWPGKTYPTNEKLNALFPDKPVFLARVDGHAAIVNQKAFDLAHVTAGQTIAGGEVEIRNGKLTGVLIDNAKGLIGSKIPDMSAEEYEKRLLAAQYKCFSEGLTTVSDCGINYRDVNAIDQLQKQDKLKMRLYVLLSDDPDNFQRYLPKGPYKTDRLFVKGFKFYADGALGSRGACLLQPYSDRAGWKGFLLNTPQHYDSMARILANTNFQMCTHAIGDSANRLILETYARVLKGKNDKRWRIEHAQVINPSDFKLFGQSSVIPSVQPTHATSDMYWAGERLGAERLKTAYAYQQLLKENGWLPLGTDFPVEDISPFKTFLAAVIRKDAKGFPPTGFQPDNALTKEQAIRGMTIWAAKASFLENEVGSVEKNKKADFIVLDRDLYTTADTAILATNVIATYSGGKKVFDASKK